MIKSENLIKLKELTDKICSMEDSKCECTCKSTVSKIKDILNEEIGNIGRAKTKQEKFSCYERMCQTITNLLNKIS
jgi:hypothetical protein